MYGVPHGRGANLLMWRTDKVTPAPDCWGVVFDANSPYKGKVTAYDSPIYIADAALYLMKTQPDLGIKNPYALDDKQFQAAVDLLKKQRKIIGEYWSRLRRRRSGGVQERRHRARDDLAGIANLLGARQGAGEDDAAEGGRHRLVGHVDDLLARRSTRTACTCG